jgi:hypothetical protein
MIRSAAIEELALRPDQPLCQDSAWVSVRFFGCARERHRILAVASRGPEHGASASHNKPVYGARLSCYLLPFSGTDGLQVMRQPLARQ